MVQHWETPIQTDGLEFVEYAAPRFGEGKFRALFESMELDQIRRGTLKPAA